MLFRSKGRKIAAHALEASEADIEFEAGEFRVKGTDKKVGFGDVALSAYVPHNYPLEELEPGLDESAFYDPANFTFPAGCHICEVEVDPETGETKIELAIDLDGSGKASVDTGVPFLDHMLDALSRHSLIDLDVHARGDTHVDDHHTVEDVGIALGQAIDEALGDKKGIGRFGHAEIPLDEALVAVTVDLSEIGRAHV